MFWNNLVVLCNQKNTTPTAVVNALGIAAGSVTKWKAGATPRSTTLQKLADYFGVSVDYLLGKTEQKEKPTADGGEPIDPKLREALKIMSELPPERQAEAMNYLRFLSNSSNNQ